MAIITSAPRPTYTRARSLNLKTLLLPILDKPPTFPTSTSSTGKARAPDPAALKRSGETPADDAPSSVAEAALHLLLLEVFWVLFWRIDEKDTRNEDEEEEEEGGGGEGEKEDILPRRRAWLAHAVRRFEAWWAVVAKAAEEDRKAGEGDAADERTEIRELKPEHQPPLDVLLVWHAYLLNPGWYSRDCKRLYGPGMLAVEFPWDMIRESVDLDTLTYTLPERASTFFTTHIIPEPSDLFYHLSALPLPTDAPDHPTPLQGCECRTPSAPQPLPPSASHPPASPTLCLTSAIIRQYSFVSKMHDILYLRSPTLVSTLQRAQTRCLRFFDLFRMYPGDTMIPTLDVDLIWHTQQLCPLRYRRFCECPNRAARWINHDDTYPKKVLEDQFQVTAKRYAELCGESYGGCLCWSCELVREEEGWEKVGKDSEGEKTEKGKKGKEQLKWWEVKKARRVWERRVVVEFWRQVEWRRGEEEGLHKDALKMVFGGVY